MITFLLLFHALNSTGQCAGNLISNGSFNSPEGVSVIAPGWTGEMSPDVNDANGPLVTTPGYVWFNGTPVASSDGGTWQNLFSGSEIIEQTLNLTVGESYTLTFEYTAQGIQYDTSYSFTNPVGIHVYFNNVFATATPMDSTLFIWENHSYTFTAASNVVVIKISPNTDAYIAIDGICLLPASSVVSMPDIFTPDNNGINDLFHPINMTNNLSEVTLKIVNRWGNLVYETNDPMSGWNGQFNEEDCTEGVYFWILTYTINNDQTKESGYLHLMRD